MAALPTITIAVLVLCLILVVGLCVEAFGKRRRLRRWNDRNRRDMAPAGTPDARPVRKVRWFPRRAP